METICQMSKKIIRNNRSEVGSHVIIDRQTGIVEKYFSVDALQKYPGLIKREVFWLEKLESFDRTPKLISYDMENRVVVMDYMGESLTKQNIPNDYEKQMEYILGELKQFECDHNDIKPSELLVLDGKINIIDFAWSTNLGEPIPRHWPPRVGGIDFRFKLHELDDEYSFKKAINWILNR